MRKNNFLYKGIALLTGLVICLTAVSLSFVTVSAAFSGGSGTKKDPYLVKTADDLYNIRNELSAHYKLAATIDMGGYKTDSKFFKNGFVPIGDDSTKPFKGSFTCDLGSDGLPLYAILNLNVYNAKGDIYKHDWYGAGDYPDAMGQSAPFFYQTGLFGTTSGAYIANIYLLNSTVYSSVVGQHDGRYADGSEGSLISYKVFMDEQATGGLIGCAKNSTVTHCAVTGSVTGKTSSHGGLIGNVSGTTVSACYVNVSVDTGGCWSIGGMFGRLSENSVINYCCAYGTLSASLDGYGKMQSFGQNPGDGAGGLFGSINNATVQNSYSAVNLSSKTKGNNFYGYASGSGSNTINNVYSNGAYEGKTSAPAGTSNDSNCYISNAVNGLQADFKAASPADITAYFTTQNGWASGADGYPQISAVSIVADPAIYVPGGERETKTVAAAEPTNETTEVGTSSADDTASNTNTAGTGTTTVEAASDNGSMNTVQLVMIALLSVMIIVISVLSVVMVYNTLHTDNSDITEIYPEGVQTDE